MTKQLRHLSRRPQLIAGALSTTVIDANQNFVGKGGLGVIPALTPWLGAARMVTALKADGGPRKLVSEHIVRDDRGVHLIDPDGYLIGKPAVVVMRMLDAGKVINTRRL